jgi:hypothetical protein
MIFPFNLLGNIQVIFSAFSDETLPLMTEKLASLPVSQICQPVF